MDLGVDRPKSTFPVVVRDAVPIRAVSLAARRSGCGRQLERKDVRLRG
jgi:hypothetical protein